MASFLSFLKIRALTRDELIIYKSKEQLYELLEDFSYSTHLKERDIIITVPTFFISDFGSVPPIVKGIIDDDDPSLLYPSIIHDYLYYYSGTVFVKCGEDQKIELHLNRKECDDILAEAMKAVFSPAWKRLAVYKAVRLGGWLPWKNDIKKRLLEEQKTKNDTKHE